MIINTEYKYIHVHVPKNGGHTVSRLLTHPNSFRPSKIFKHMELKWINNSRIINECCDYNFGKDYKAFSVVRNPWSRMQSLYYYTRNTRSTLLNQLKKDHWLKFQYQETIDKTLNEWLITSDYIPKKMKPSSHYGYFDIISWTKKSQFDWWTDAGGNMLAYKILRIENLIEEIQNYFEEMGYHKIIAPKKERNIIRNKGIKPIHYQNYQDEYNEEGKKHVAKYFEREIDEFKYTF